MGNKFTVSKYLGNYFPGSYPHFISDMNVKDLREKHNLSQQELSEKTGIPRDRIAKWEQGKGNPKSEDYNILSAFFAALTLEDVPRGTYVEQRMNHKLNSVREGIPIYEDAPYTLGNVESYRDTPTDKADFWVTIPGLKNCNYGCRATGDSMHPLIRSHALVVGEEITDTSFIPSGDIYIVRAKNGMETIKYVQTHETDPKKFVLVPYNKNAKPTEILKKDIIKIYKAKAVFNVL